MIVEYERKGERMGEFGFDLTEWEEMKKYWKSEEIDGQWEYLLDEARTFDGFDPDSSPYAWNNVYKRIYTSGDWGFWGMFDFENLKRKGIRKVAFASRNLSYYENFFKEDEKARKWCEWPSVKIAGDVDFNFKKYYKNENLDKSKYYEEENQDKSIGYYLYKNRIETCFKENPQKKDEYLCKLDWCERRMHSLENFSLMLVSGGMNNFKGKKPNNDRIDKFIYKLDDYFRTPEEKKGVHEIIKFANKNGEVLYEYLSLFEDIYDYCKKIYKINEERVVKRFIALGKKDTFEGEDIVEFMNLAECYWRKKHEIIGRCEREKICF